MRVAVEKEEAFDFAFIDRALPDEDGKEFASRLKSELSFRRTRLILINELGKSDKPGSLVRAGLDAWMKKPILSIMGTIITCWNLKRPKITPMLPQVPTAKEY